MQLRNKKILIISQEAWGNIRISKHHYAVELQSMGNEVFFLNPPDLNVKGVQVTKDEGVNIVSFYPLFRGARYLPTWMIGWLKKQTASKIIRAIGKIDITWCFDPVNYPDLRVFQANLNIFHPVDLIRDKHANVHKSADIIFCVTETDRAYLETGNAKVHFIPHGLNKVFEQLAMDIAKQPTETSGDSITIGFIGSLFKESLDRNTLRCMMSTDAELRFIFIGPYERKNVNISGYYEQPVFDFIEFLKQQPNVVLTGALQPKEMVTYMLQPDAWINCELSGLSNLWDGSNSHKLMEYLATGKVVISTFVATYPKQHELFAMLPDSEGDYVKLFDETIARLAMYNNEVYSRKRIEFALDNTYRKQVQRIEACIADF